MPCPGEAGMIWMTCINSVIAEGYATIFPTPDVTEKPFTGFVKFMVEIFS